MNKTVNEQENIIQQYQLCTLMNKGNNSINSSYQYILNRDKDTSSSMYNTIEKQI